MNKKRHLILFACLAAILICCQNPNVEKLRHVKSWTQSFEDSANNYNIFKGDAAAGSCFAHLGNKVEFSPGIDYTLSDSLANRDLRIYIDCAARRTCDNIGYLVLAFTHGDTGKYWRAFNANDYLSEINQWQRMTDSTQIPPRINNSKGITMHIYGWNPAKDSTFFDLDDIKVLIREVRTEKREAH